MNLSAICAWSMEYGIIVRRPAKIRHALTPAHETPVAAHAMPYKNPNAAAQ